METALQLAQVSRWLTPENRRREGLRAAHQQNAEALIQLMQTYIQLKSVRRGRTSPLTLKTYGQSVKKFLLFTGPADSPNHALNQLTPDVFELWLLQLQHEGLSANTVKRHLYGVRNLIKALVWAEVIKQDITQGISPPAEATPNHARKKPLSQRQLKALLQLPLQQHPHQLAQATRDQVLLLLGGVLGLRAAELVGLNLSDIDLPELTLTVRGKGSKTRQIPLTSGVAGAISQWLVFRSDLGKVGPAESLLVSLSRATDGQRLSTDGARYIAEQYYKLLGLSPELWGLHTLRRTAGTQLYRATRDLHVVADLLGHSSINTSAVYARMDMDVRREALQALERQYGED
ncbi:tyrosine recombinase XerC [Deinococcus rubellus]|uniref:Tyrosine-type recombinase/integrase n=1 Tax=Deinococcus rubellus TaxID=1889240 RepID=A0ABY5YG42_9DEIO|nr:tyrosine-type recombinase/integrase [Deinococcus rubellus]UWX63072.1 tyrosine-type recombinase/integrase [Deinococcus rubellus]